MISNWVQCWLKYYDPKRLAVKQEVRVAPPPHPPHLAVLDSHIDRVIRERDRRR